MGEWYLFDGGRSIGQRGSEGDSILRDEEHPDGSRITLEGGGKSFSITCGIYGWMVHTRFFSDETEAQNAFDEMKAGLVNILNIIPLEGESADAKMEAVTDALTDFIERFP